MWYHIYHIYSNWNTLKCILIFTTSVHFNTYSHNIFCGNNFQHQFINIYFSWSSGATLNDLICCQVGSWNIACCMTFGLRNQCLFVFAFPAWLPVTAHSLGVQSWQVLCALANPIKHVLNVKHMSSFTDVKHIVKCFVEMVWALGGIEL